MKNIWCSTIGSPKLRACVEYLSSVSNIMSIWRKRSFGLLWFNTWRSCTVLMFSWGIKGWNFHSFSSWKGPKNGCRKRVLLTSMLFSIFETNERNIGYRRIEPFYNINLYLALASPENYLLNQMARGVACMYLYYKNKLSVRARHRFRRTCYL